MELAQAGKALGHFVFVLLEHQHSALAGARDAGHQQATVARNGNALPRGDHVFFVFVGLEHIGRHARDRRIEIGIDPVAPCRHAQRARQAMARDLALDRLDQQRRKQAGADRAGEQPGFVGLVTGKQFGLEPGERTAEIVDPVQRQRRIGCLAITAPGAAF